MSWPRALISALTWPTDLPLFARALIIGARAARSGVSQSRAMREGMEVQRLKIMELHSVCEPADHRFLHLPPPVDTVWCEHCARTPAELDIVPTVIRELRTS